MTSPDQAARDSDRDAAIKVVEAAFKSGRIIEADRDMRVDQLKSAQTLQDIDIQVRDLRPRQPAAAAGMAAPTVSVSTSPAGQPWPHYGPPQGAPSQVEVTELVGKAGKAIGGIIIAVVVVSVIVPIIGVVIALVAARDSFDVESFGQPSDETTYLPGQDPPEGGINVHTVDGYQALVDAVRDETGATMTFDVTMYPRYAVLTLPVQEGTGRYQLYYWDGELDRQDSKGTTTDTAFDLTELRPELTIRLLKKVRGEVEDPTIWYVSARAPADTAPQVLAYACNDFSECEYLIATFDGKIIYDSTAS